MDTVPDARTQRIAETLLPGSASSQVRGCGGTIDGTIENALNDAIFSGDIVTVTAMNGPLTHRFDAFVETLDYVQEEVHLVKRNLDVEIIPFKQILSVTLTE